MNVQGKADFIVKMLAFTGALMSLVFSLTGLVGGILFILKLMKII